MSSAHLGRGGQIHAYTRYILCIQDTNHTYGHKQWVYKVMANSTFGLSRPVFAL